MKHRLLDYAGTAAKINVALKPRDRSCVLEMAHVLIAQGRLPEATAVVERWLDNSRGDNLAHLLACELHIEQSNPSEAKSYLAAAAPVDYKPEFVHASERLNRLGW